MQQKNINQTISIKIGKKIHFLRRVKKMSQTDLGRCLNITGQQIQKYESGANEISVVKLYKLAEIFGVNVKELLADEEITTKIIDIM